ncbi:preprotein translocase subunit SecG [Paralcaligenes sp. KSB-10]|uniref:preprotein translocase subunit SecG n=1 Tax=Paralcaligenes sp. KSB-10 TaxID=2901142 RepID=UPI001E58CA66|nr:preprotein translocase subunit SecG [Paralcaligenes sp. KSB-10]UHL66123.1 preprotein translocase subunit SecG [Paralcaligenes sp. KSB-10]
MQWLSPALLAIQVITSLAIIVLVLLQQGKGADMGSAFGGGSAGSLFGATGAANFLSRTTKWAAIVFFASTAGLAYVAHHPASSILEGGVMQGFKQAPAPAAPVGSAVPSVPGSSVPAAKPAAGGTSPAVPGASAIPTVPSTSSAVPAAAEGAKPASSSDKPAGQSK